MADASLRQRKDAPKTDASQDVTIEPTKATRSSEQGLSLLDTLRAIVGIILLNSLLSYFVTGESFTWGYRPWWTRADVLKQRFFKETVVLTDSELSQYDGRDPEKPIYLALNGTIYDVSSGRQTYGPGGPYNVFAGRDAARAFVTGCFRDDAIPDMRGAEWTYIPNDVPHFKDQSDEDLSEMERQRRHNAVKQALEQVEDTIDGWAKVFRGETGKNYWEVGYVRRKPGQIETLPIKALCEPAEKQRPKPKFKKTDPGKAYRKGQ